MPYENQKAGKGGHVDLVKNPDVSGFLSDCEYLREPTEEEGNEIAQTFQDAPSGGAFPEKVVASDASPYIEPINGKFPSTQVGYIKLSFVLIKLTDYNGLAIPGGRFVDPFKVAALHRNADGIAFTLPGSNIRYKNALTVKDGFRLAVWDQLSGGRTNFSKSGPYSVADTLFDISNGRLHVKSCPNCGHEPAAEFVLTPALPSLACPECETQIYATDSLRLYEEISDFGSNASPMTRFMNAVAPDDGKSHPYARGTATRGPLEDGFHSRRPACGVRAARMDFEKADGFIPSRCPGPSRTRFTVAGHPRVAEGRDGDGPRAGSRAFCSQRAIQGDRRRLPQAVHQRGGVEDAKLWR